MPLDNSYFKGLIDAGVMQLCINNVLFLYYNIFILEYIHLQRNDPIKFMISCLSQVSLCPCLEHENKYPLMLTTALFEI